MRTTLYDLRPVWVPEITRHGLHLLSETEQQVLTERNLRELKDKAGCIAAQIEQARSALAARHERITRHVEAMEVELDTP